MHDSQVQVLKADLFGRVELVHLSGQGVDSARVRRDTRAAVWWARALARLLARREERALKALRGMPQVAQSLAHPERGVWERSYLPGQPMQVARPTDVGYFDEARRLLGRLHRAGVTHNDLAKEPNWLVMPDGKPGLVDFQLASVHRRRSARFRMQGREDLRHLLKHKRTYCPERLTERERAILARPSWVSRLWRQTGKRVYLWITRGLLGWADREGAGDRNKTYM